MSARGDEGRIEQHEHRYAGYEAHDHKGEVIGEVDDLFVDRVDRQEYIELNMGFLGLRSTLVPMELCEVDDEAKVVRIPRSRTVLRRAPRKKLTSLTEDETAAITPEYEDRIREYYGLENIDPPASKRPVRVFSSVRRSGRERSFEERPSTGVGELRPVRHRVLERRSADEETGSAEARDAKSVGGQAGEPVSSGRAATEGLAGLGDPVGEPKPVGERAAARDDRDAEPHEAAKPAEEIAPSPPRMAETVGGGETPEDEGEKVAQRGNESEAEAAVREMSDAVRQATRTLDYRASAFGESGTKLAQESLRSLAEQAGEGSRGTVRAAQDLQAQGLRQQQAYGAVLQGTASAYTSFLSSAAILYQQGLLTAAQVALGNLQAANRVWRTGTRGAAPAPEGSAAGGTPDVTATGSAFPGNPGAPQGAPTAPGPRPGNAAAPRGAESAGETEQGVPGAEAGTDTGQPATAPETGSAGGSTPEAGQGGAVGAAGVPLGVVLPPPPEAPNILDELPPPPEVPTVEDLDDGSGSQRPTP